MKKPLLTKPAKYFLGILIVFLVFELLFNCFSNIFSNTTDRIRLKSAMFDYRDKTEILFLGSSRFKDGISPNLFCVHLDSISKIEMRGFNGAITGANIERLEFFFNKAVEKTGVEHIVIEISRPQLKRKKEDIKSTEEETEDLDSKISTVLENNSKLILWRKSLRFDNLKNIPAILFANHMEGSELYKKDAFSDYTKSIKSKLTPETKETWKYETITPSEVTTVSDSDKIIYDTFNRIVKKAKEYHVNISFIIPPLVNESKMKETSLDAKKRFQNLSNITKTVIYNFSTANIDESFFRDKDSHLNKEGRYIFSSMLAELFNNEYHLKQ